MNKVSQQIDSLFATFAKDVQPGVAVMVIQDSNILHQSSYGYADLEKKTPITSNTAFDLASVSKQFVAMALMMLAESGRLGYDDPVAAYLPELSHYKDVTLRHVLTHTSGLPNFYDQVDDTAPPLFNTDALRLLAGMDELDFVPGEKCEYCNAGYDILPLVVEAASGMAFADFMHQKIFTPLQMNDSLFNDHTQPVIKNRASSYWLNDEKYQPCNDHPLSTVVGGRVIIFNIGGYV